MIRYIGANTWGASLPLELLHRQPVLPQNHFIKEKVEFSNPHLAQNGMISTEPDIGLLGHGGIEIPACAVSTDELWKDEGTAMVGALDSLLLVLAFPVKHIHRESYGPD
jgi:hypothetical protein